MLNLQNYSIEFAKTAILTALLQGYTLEISNSKSSITYNTEEDSLRSIYSMIENLESLRVHNFKLTGEKKNNAVLLQDDAIYEAVCQGPIKIKTDVAVIEVDEDQFLELYHNKQLKSYFLYFVDTDKYAVMLPQYSLQVEPVPGKLAYKLSLSVLNNNLEHYVHAVYEWVEKFKLYYGLECQFTLSHNGFELIVGEVCNVYNEDGELV